MFHIWCLTSTMMYFTAGVEVTILFRQWHVTTVGGLIGSVIGIFILAMLYEGLKFFREHLYRRNASTIQYATVAVTGQSNNSGVTEIQKVTRNKMMSVPHLIQTLLHVVQFVISYFLMLMFMTYNMWVCIAIALGAGAGFFLFGWKKATVVDVTEHCH
ncbi:high affinity copper uptake protein 1-like isoform X1 [Tachypleus tridentatus]|uniref:high affinity copper uptake protein 1-like isoform X1 n=1 Tax=Tachypleus tridentatus TaxID=6853 RepID=UPI003FD5A49B